MRYLLLTIITLICGHLNAVENERHHQIALELDPAPFFLSGYSFSLKYQSSAVFPFAFMASVFSSDFPDAMMSTQNFDKGFREMRFETSTAIFAEYYFNDDNSYEGIYAGPSVFLYNNSIGYQDSDQRIEFSTIYPNVRLGYIWYPIEDLGLYVNPWINLGTEIMTSSRVSISDKEYTANSLNYIIAIHLGYIL